MVDDEFCYGLVVMGEAKVNEDKRRGRVLDELLQRSIPNAKIFLNPEPKTEYSADMSPNDVYVELGKLHSRLNFAVHHDDPVYINSVIPRFEQLIPHIPDPKFASCMQNILGMAQNYEADRAS